MRNSLIVSSAIALSLMLGGPALAGSHAKDKMMKKETMEKTDAMMKKDDAMTKDAMKKDEMKKNQ